MPDLDMSPALPEKVTVFYPTRRCSGLGSDTLDSIWYSRSKLLSSVTLEGEDADTEFKGVTNAVLIIHDSCQALMDPADADPTNKDALTDLTEQIAQDFYDFRSFSIDLVYVGICAVEPVALYDYIEFVYDADEPATDDEDRIEAIEDRMRPTCTTRVISEPWNGEVQEMQHMDPEIFDCTDENNDGDPVEVVPCITYYDGHAACNGGGAKATATIDDSDGSILSVTITSGGSYTSVPKVAISGDGSGAKFTAHLTSGAVSSVTVDVDGEGYNYAIISFNGGGSKFQLTKKKLCLEDGRLVSKFISYDTIG